MTDLLDNSPENCRAESEPALPLIPEHELLRLIGEGGGGQVWLARNAIGAYRAIKVVRKSASQSGQHFAHEFTGVIKFEPVSRLHDGLMDILQVGVVEAAGYFYCVMELADDVRFGQHIVPESYVPRTLAHDLSERGRLPIGECVRNGAALASALAFLHRHGLIHRDIKPSNIIFVNGFPKLADIGLVSTISEPRAYIGTEGFIAPEGASRPQADIYSLGKVLYQMSTGKDRNDYPELPADLGCGAEDRDLIRFNKIVLHACRTRPTRRFRSADDLLTALVTFQFATSDLHREDARRVWSNTVGFGGLLIGFGFVMYCALRSLHYLSGGQ